MILTTRFVFIHIPRTGGTFVRQLFLQSAPVDWQTRILEGHPGVNEIPPEFRQLPRIAVVRNPFDWYVSWFHYMLQIGGNPIFDAAASPAAPPDFRRTIANLLELPVGRFFPDVSDRCRRISFSWYFSYLLGGDLESVRFARFENLREELAKAFASAAELPAAFRRTIADAPPVNLSQRDRYRSYYDAELVRAVEESDRLLLEGFAYEF